MAIVLYHNPRCSKSRQAKALLDDRGVDYQTRLYLQDPLTDAELSTLISQLDGPIEALVRNKEAEYKSAGLSKDSKPTAIIQALIDYPKLLERPIVTHGDQARIGRPPERILEIL